MISKESLMGMNVNQLKGKLAEAKAKFAQNATGLSEERQAQILKTKQIRGNAANKKRELISQIMRIERQTAKVEAQRNKITVGENIKFDIEVSKAAEKVRARKIELKTTGTYQTSISGYERILSMAYDMDVDKETFDALLENFTLEELEAMSGDDFYDEIKSIGLTKDYNGTFNFKNLDSFESIMF